MVSLNARDLEVNANIALDVARHINSARSTLEILFKIWKCEYRTTNLAEVVSSQYSPYTALWKQRMESDHHCYLMAPNLLEHVDCGQG